MKKEIILGYVWPESFTRKEGLYNEDYIEQYPHEVDDVNPDEIILEGNKDFMLVIDYPLENPCEYNFKTEANGMSRIDFAELCVEVYRDIYKIESETSEIPEGHIPGMYNRLTTNGKYGIWGHDLGDLTIHTLYLNEASDKTIITLGVDS